MGKDNLGKRNKQGSVWASEYLSERLYEFTKSVLWQLSRSMDRRLVQTFFDLLMVILIQRHRNQGLLLSELGGAAAGDGSCASRDKTNCAVAPLTQMAGPIAGRLDVGARGSEG